ncbi:lactococcin 972 family bacteriocin [Corynebacterium uterequi]|uniref:lactococcin 972 family bacteriocin n=1 Tax=Corynebacterium uterequi TaxID=1072256 RepID=UPI0009E61C58
MALSSTAVAAAIVENAGGGAWDHGVNAVQVWSNYSHDRVDHGSTAVGLRTVRSGCVKPGSTSYARAPRNVRNNQSFYRHC